MKYDLIIIGAGPAGYTAALAAKGQGLEVALIERSEIGGTCLNEGCIPTKALLSGAKQAKLANASTDINLVLEAIIKEKDATVNKLKNGLLSLFKNSRIPCINGEAEFISDCKVKVGAEIYTSDNFLIATGARVSLPPIQGIEHAFTSTQILSDSFEMPDNIAIIGGGVIGTEFASFFAYLGAKVTIYEALPRILSTFSPDAAKYAALLLRAEKISIKTNTKISKIEKKDNSFFVHYGNEVAEYGLVIVAAGRVPVLPKGLDKAGVEVEKGGIIAPYLATNREGIYAVGDVVSGNIQLAHLASYQARAVVDLISGKKDRYIAPPIPQVVYLNTEIASVGLSEVEAEKAGYTIAVGRASTAANGMSLIEGKGRGYYKVIFDANTQKILGAELVAHNASEMVGGIGALIAIGADYTAILNTCWPHPSVAEGFYDACLTAFAGAMR